MVVIVVGAMIVVGVMGVALGRQWGLESKSTTSAKTTTTSSSVAQPQTAIWPFASTVTHFGDPVLAAKAFATDYLGFTSPLVGSFQQGDSRSGEVPIKATPNGPVTTIIMRQLTSANSWWVLGASCPGIMVMAPSAMESIASPVLLKGRSTAYEAVVNVEVLQDETLTPLKSQTVMGGSLGKMGPFSKSVSFAPPSHRRGALLFRTYSAKDGHVVEASVIRVAFLK